MKKTKYLLLALIVIVGSLYYLWTQRPVASSKLNLNKIVKELPEENKAPLPTLAINFVFADGHNELVNYTYPAQASYSLLAITQSIAQQKKWTWNTEDYKDLGTLVTQIGEDKNGQDNKYWQYYVDDKMPLVSADKYFPNLNDKIKWVFQVSKY